MKKKRELVLLKIFIQFFHLYLAKLCKEYNLNQFIHLSALGINQAVDSNYAKSKLEGEKNILSKFSIDYNIKTFCSLFNR